MKILEILGTILGISGTILISTKLASEREWRLWVFILYFISNIFLSIVMYNSKLYFAFGMQVVYFITSINGIRNNWKNS